MPDARPARLLGDVGGTNARFAWQDADGAPLRDIATIPTADHPTLAAALAHYLHGIERAAPLWCAIGIANPITGDRVQMTNSHWSFSIEAVRRDQGRGGRAREAARGDLFRPCSLFSQTNACESSLANP